MTSPSGQGPDSDDEADRRVLVALRELIDDQRADVAKAGPHARAVLMDIVEREGSARLNANITQRIKLVGEVADSGVLPHLLTVPSESLVGQVCLSTGLSEVWAHWAVEAWRTAAGPEVMGTKSVDCHAGVGALDSPDRPDDHRTGPSLSISTVRRDYEAGVVDDEAVGDAGRPSARARQVQRTKSTEPIDHNGPASVSQGPSVAPPKPRWRNPALLVSVSIICFTGVVAGIVVLRSETSTTGTSSTSENGSCSSGGAITDSQLDCRTTEPIEEETSETSAREDELLASLPVGLALRDSCEGETSSTAIYVATQIRCTPAVSGAATEIIARAFTSADNLNAYLAERNLATLDQGTCDGTADVQGTWRYSANPDVTVGRIFCYVSPATGNRLVIWDYSRQAGALSLVLIAARAPQPATLSDLVRWWQNQNLAQ